MHIKVPSQVSLIDCLVFKHQKTIRVWDTKRKNNSLTRKFIKNHHMVVTSLVNDTLPSPPSQNIQNLLNSARKRNKHKKIILLASSKLNSLEQIVSKALINSDISHEELALLINEEENYFRLKERIRKKNIYDVTLKGMNQYNTLERLGLLKWLSKMKYSLKL